MTISQDVLNTYGMALTFAELNCLIQYGFKECQISSSSMANIKDKAKPLGLYFRLFTLAYF